MEGTLGGFRLITTRTMLSYGCVYAPVWLCVMCVCVVYKDHLWKVILGGFRLITTRTMLSYGCVYAILWLCVCYPMAVREVE